MSKSIAKIIILFTIFLFVPKFALAEEPLVYANNLEYLGAFRVPSGAYGGTGDNYSFAFGGGVMTYNPVNNSLLISGHIYNQMVAEISIPEPVYDSALENVPQASANLSALNVATVLQNFSDITEGNRSKIGEDGATVSTSGVYLGGLLVSDDNKLLGTSFGFYDASGAVKLSHFTSNLNLAQTGDFAGMFKVDTTTGINPGYLDGFMSKIPQTWQTNLGGTALTGNGGLSIISRTSSGPAAFAFEPSQLGITNPVLATPLLYYPLAHNTLHDSFFNAETLSNPYFNLTTKIAGMAMIPGSRSVLFLGYHGIGSYGYGEDSSNPIFADVCHAPDVCVTGSNGWPVCQDPANCVTGHKGLPNDPLCADGGTSGCYYDPTSMGAKGPHAYPYIYQIWAYDANDFMAVKNGTKNPWEVLPYAVWKMPYKFVSTTLFGGAMAYDPNTQRLFVSEPGGEKSGCCSPLPLIHVFHVNLSAVVAQSYKINGQAMLLNGSVILKNNTNNEELTLTSADRTITQNFSFPTAIASGSNYDVTVASQPATQQCDVINGSGVLNANTDIGNMLVTCQNTNDPIAPTAPSGLSAL